MSLNTAFREAEDIKRLQKVIEKRVEEIGVIGVVKVLLCVIVGR